MKLIEPKVELWSEENISPESHIAKCARVCYGKEAKLPDQEADKKMVDGLIKRGHLSMLRHATIYFRFGNVRLGDTSDWMDVCPYNNSFRPDSSCIYLSVNHQEYRFSDNFRYIGNSYTPSEILKFCETEPELFRIFRLTFCITTQISTSRELNRVSPNNIAERSTRYVKSDKGLEICKPWWWEMKIGSYTVSEIAKLPNYYKVIAMAWHELEESYMELLKCGMKPENARGVLPLDTSTKVIYTYSVEQWAHIIDLRYYGRTGKPHENARIVIGMVKDQINEFAKAHNIDYTV